MGANNDAFYFRSKDVLGADRQPDRETAALEILLDRYTAIPYMIFMDVSFDPSNDAKNLEKHKLPLSFGEAVLVNKFAEVEDQRHEYGEKRMKSLCRT